MTPDERDDIEATAREASWYLKQRTLEPECGATITYGRVVVACTKPAGHPPVRHDTATLSWPAV